VPDDHDGEPRLRADGLVQRDMAHLPARTRGEGTEVPEHAEGADARVMSRVRRGAGLLDVRREVDGSVRLRNGHEAQRHHLRDEQEHRREPE
jgi:hypothetical protein